MRCNAQGASKRGDARQTRATPRFRSISTTRYCMGFVFLLPASHCEAGPCRTLERSEERGRGRLGLLCRYPARHRAPSSIPNAFSHTCTHTHTHFSFTHTHTLSSPRSRSPVPRSIGRRPHPKCAESAHTQGTRYRQGEEKNMMPCRCGRAEQAHVMHFRESKCDDLTALPHHWRRPQTQTSTRRMSASRAAAGYNRRPPQRKPCGEWAITTSSTTPTSCLHGMAPALWMRARSGRKSAMAVEAVLGVWTRMGQGSHEARASEDKTGHRARQMLRQGKTRRQWREDDRNAETERKQKKRLAADVEFMACRATLAQLLGFWLWARDSGADRWCGGMAGARGPVPK